MEESSPRSPGPFFMHSTDDVHASDSDTKHNGNGDSKRYAVASVEFTRVETPFIIGVWIFCASLAKIGEYHNNVMCIVYGQWLYRNVRSVSTTDLPGVTANVNGCINMCSVRYATVVCITVIVSRFVEV